MTTYIVTTSNWNDAAFWNAISETGPGHTLDFSALPSNFSVDFYPDFDRIAISDDTTTLIIGDSDFGGTSFATMAGTTQLEYFTTVLGSDGGDYIDGGANADTLKGGDGADYIAGWDGDDAIYGGAGADFIDGGDGSDDIYIEDGFGADSIDGGAGTQDDLKFRSLSSGISVTATGDGAGTATDGTDTLQFSNIEDIDGSDKNDVIDLSADSSGMEADGFLGDDSITGGSGNDDIDGDEGNDTLSGQGGNDTIAGGSGSDTIEGGSGNDALFGGDGNDSLNGGDGNDTLTGGDGIDSLVGGAGDDTLYGGAGNDFLLGREGADSMFGGAGADILDGGEDNDTIEGGADNDTILGQSGDDTLYGGDGDDLMFSHSGEDTVMGGDGNDRIFTGSENDVAFGGAGNDSITGDAGDDVLTGGAGNDNIDGGNGDDSLIGGTGADTLTGGDGDDTFVWDGGSSDEITDFGVGSTNANDGDNTNNDFVDLSGIFNAGTLAAYNAANGTTFATSLGAMNHDLANGVIDFNGTDMTGPTLTMTGVTGGLNFEQTNVVCFAEGTLIKTANGDVPIEDLTAGDSVLTADDGLQNIRWIGSRKLDSIDLAVNPKLRPMRISAGALGDNLPEADLVVSPQHRILVRSVIAERMFSETEVLIPAIKLREIEGVNVVEDMTEVTYFHMLFDAHQIVFSNGAETESLFTGPQALKAVSSDARMEIIQLFPNLEDPEFMEIPVRHIPEKGRLMRELVRRIVKNQKPAVETELNIVAWEAQRRDSPNSNASK